MDRNRNILTLIPITKQLWLLVAFFVPILVWKRVETGISKGQIVFIYCLLILGFFETLRASAATRTWILEKKVPNETANEVLAIPVWVWRIMTIAAFTYMLLEKT